MTTNPNWFDWIAAGYRLVLSKKVARFYGGMASVLLAIALVDLRLMLAVLGVLLFADSLTDSDKTEV